MHYRNGREAKNGDKIIQIGGYGSGADSDYAKRLSLRLPAYR